MEKSQESGEATGLTLPIAVEDVIQAANRLRGIVLHTPLLESDWLNARIGGRVFLKPECLQKTGSFKLRGAYNRLSQLDAVQRRRGVVAFSSGNHAAGVAKAAKMLGIPAVIVMPADAPSAKMENTRFYGADIRTYDRFKEDREAIARALCEETGATLVPSFNDVDIMAGQGTLGLEIAEDLRKRDIVPDQVLAPCGGGGLASGSFTALASYFPNLTPYVVEPEGYDDTAQSLAAGSRQSIQPGAKTICDALLADSPGPLPYAVLTHLGTQGLVVSDEEVKLAMRYAAEHLKLVVEPGGAVALAAILAGKVDAKGRVTVCVLSGGNVDIEAYPDLIAP